MTNLLKSKRGVSPLIATILLIAFAVALGAVVMNIGKTTLTADPGTIFTILALDGKQQVCYFDRGAESMLEITLKNGNEEEIADMQVSLIGTNDILNKNKVFAEPLKKAEVRRIKLPFDSYKLGTLKKLVITPEVLEDGSSSLKKSLEIEAILPC